MVQKYVEALEFFMTKKCEVAIYENLANTYTVAVDDGGRKAHGTCKSWRRAIVKAKQDYLDYKGK